MKIRFSKNDVIDTAALAEMGAAWTGEGDDIIVSLTEKELGWLEGFMEMCYKASHDGDLDLSFGLIPNAGAATSAITIDNGGQYPMEEQ